MPEIPKMSTTSFRVILRSKYFEPIIIFARRNPLLTNTVAYAGIGGLAEFTQQAISRSPGEKFQWTRVFHFTVIGVCFNGPVGHYWYRWLDKAIPIGSKMAVAKKIFLDMSICLPVYIVAFYAGTLWDRFKLTYINVKIFSINILTDSYFVSILERVLTRLSPQ